MKEVYSKIRLVILGTVAATTATTYGFTLLASFKPFTSPTYYVDIEGSAINGTPFNALVEEAMENLNQALPPLMQLSAKREYADPCMTGDGKNTLALTETFCGEPWNEFGASGVAHLSYTGQIIANTIDVEADISLSRMSDESFRGAAGHELSHALGLDHSIFASSILKSPESRVARLPIDDPTPDDLCGIKFLHGDPTNCEIYLAGSARTDGKPTTAMFFGGGSSEEGHTYQENFHIKYVSPLLLDLRETWPSLFPELAPNVLDVMATIVVEQGDFDKKGKLYVIAELGGELLALNSDEQWQPIAPDLSNLVAAQSKTLHIANEVYVIEKLDLQRSGLADMDVNFFLGYTVDDEPTNLTFSPTPIKVSIRNESPSLE